MPDAVQGPLVCTVKTDIEANTVRDGRSHQLRLEIAPGVGPATGGVDHPELNHVGGLIQLFLTHRVHGRPRYTTVDAVVKFTGTRVRTVGLDGGKTAPHVVGVGQHGSGTGDGTVRPTPALHGPPLIGRVGVKRFVEMAVERPTTNLRCFTVRCFLHVNLEPEEGVGVGVDHPQVSPGRGETFKPWHGRGGGGVQHLPLKQRTGVNHGIHVEQTVGQVFPSTQQRGAKDIGRPVALAVAGTTAGGDDDVVHPSRVRARVDAAVFGVLPGQRLSRGGDREGLQSVVHGAGPAVAVAAVSSASGVVNAKEQVVEAALRGDAVAERSGGCRQLRYVKCHARFLVVADGPCFGQLRTTESRVGAHGPVGRPRLTPLRSKGARFKIVRPILGKNLK